MPGFGQGPFGREPFGQWPWSKQVLFDSLPALYKDQDADNGRVLETFTESLRPSFDRQLSDIANWEELRDPLRVRTQYNVTTSIQLGKIKDPDSRIEQRGVDGGIDASRAFKSSTARFRTEDIGKTIILSNSAVPINNRTFKIAQIVNTTTVRCDPPLVVDPGPLRWLVKGFPVIPEGVFAIEVRGGDVSSLTPGWTLFDGGSEFDIISRSQFYPISGEARALTEQEGAAAIAESDGRCFLGVTLAQTDVGKPLTITGSAVAQNNGKWQIYKVDASDQRLTLHKSITIVGSDANGGIVYTLKPGNTGVRVSHVIAGISTLLNVAVRGQDIVVYLATNGSGVATSTATQVAAAVTAAPTANVFVTAVVTGTGGSVAGASDFVLIPGVSLGMDATPQTWALLPYPEIRITTAAPPLGITEQENHDLVIEGVDPNQVRSDTAKFTDSDVGNLFVIRGSVLGNDGVYPIASVVAGNILVVTSAVTLVAEAGLYWEVRTPASFESSGLLVQAHAPSLIQYLAQDFGVEIDTNESEARQRSWVENITQWVDLKGTVKSYQIIGAISGFDVTPSALYRVSKIQTLQLPGDHIFLVGETDPGRSGSDGMLTQPVSRARLKSATAVFYKHDVGNSVRLSNSANGLNNQLFEIAAWISSTEIEFDPTDLYLVPDYGIGGTALAPTIQWELVRIYTDLAPSRARYDEVNVELMQQIVGPPNFLMDSYCWEDDFLEEFPINITNVNPDTATGAPIFYTVEVTGIDVGGGNYSSAGVVGVASRWEITDVSGRTFSLESLPIDITDGPPPIFTFQVFAGEVPTIGPATMRYLCDSEALSCDYCKSAVVLALIEEGTIATEVGANVSKALESVVDRLVNEVKPAHVELICALKQTIPASVTIGVTITTP